MRTYWKSLFIWLPLFILWYLPNALKHRLACGNVSALYYHAAQNWLHQLPLYTCPGNDCFVYFPTTASLFLPFASLSLPVYSVIFLFLSLVLLTFGIYCFARHISEGDQKRAFFFSLLITAVFSKGALVCGQMHAIMIGFLLLGYVAIAREKFWQAALYLTLAVALKPTAIVLYLLALALYPKLSLKLLTVTVLFFLATFITQSPHYVLTQYAAYPQRFLDDMRFDAGHGGDWATFFGAINFYTHHVINGATQFGIRLLSALLTFLFCLFVRIKCNTKEAVYFILALGLCYLMLFNSRTENNDYMMIAPMVGYSLALAIDQKKYWDAYSLGFGVILVVIIMDVRILQFGNIVWYSPTAIFIWLLYLLLKIHRHRSLKLR
ncbi:MAG: glycosyltransferase family 87 protein [Gammaproteobacteria bacterium]|nr:glycosyltransferase family 87 protein [Gammaproteobacteria bacterium]